jgi:hypothetical protein
MSVSLLLNLTAFLLAGLAGFWTNEKGTKILALAVALMALSRIVLL